MKTLLITLMMVIGASAQANDFETISSTDELDVLQTIRYSRIRPCDSWRSSRRGSGYTCSYPGMSKRLVELDSLVHVLRDLYSRIGHLETEITRLKRQ